MLHNDKPMSKSQKKQIRREGISAKTGLKIQDITPLTKNQEKAFDAWYQNKDLFMSGSAGTGKTMLALYFGLREILLDNADKIIIVRSVVPSRDMGFLPGNVTEKSKMFELPYHELCNNMYGRGDAYGILKTKGIINFTTTSFMRGLTFDNAVIIIDEFQNMAWHELNTIMGRIGNYSRVIFSGDTKQSDLDERSGKNDILKMMNVCKKMDTFEFINMKPNDVVRSGKARDYILACEKLGY